ncbi:MAG: lactoylglutathione lyase, partial [Solirubrobacteraceae bacterium]|nr:lactoylglutathione lyase [Solirubrobacteraceae bacterium]
MADFEMTLGWVIVYVEDPPAAAAFYERVFGLAVEFAFDTYAQLLTGSTKLGFAAYTLGDGNFDGGVRPAALDGQP